MRERALQGLVSGLCCRVNRNHSLTWHRVIGTTVQFTAKLFLALTAPLLKEKRAARNLVTPRQRRSQRLFAAAVLNGKMPGMQLTTPLEMNNPISRVLRGVHARDGVMFGRHLQKKAMAKTVGVCGSQVNVS